MVKDDPLVMIADLRTWIEERFRSLEATSSDEAKKDAARARLREVADVIRQLERLQLSVDEEIRSEKAALEKLLHTPNEDENQLTVLAEELSPLVRDIKGRLKDIRDRRTPRGVKSRPKRLRVEFPDGTIFCENKAVDTFVQALNHIGLERVLELSIKLNRRPLVSTQRLEQVRAAKELNGYFIETHSSTDQKARCIKQVADALHIELSASVNGH